MNKITFAALLALFAAALSAADFSFEGRWLVNGEPQRLNTATCTVSFYSSADASSPVAALSSVPFKTDSDGYFVISTNAPSTLPDTFWAGVTPAGHGEISPRFRVAPAPFALAAVEAALVTNKTQFTITGQAAIERLEVAGDMVVGDLTSANGQAIKATNLHADSLRLSSLTLANGSSIVLFDAASGVSSPAFNSFSYDKACEVVANAYTTRTGIFNQNYHVYSYDRTSSNRYNFDSDGILLIALSANPMKCPAPQITLDVGATKVLNALPVGSDASETRVERILSIPYRAGENIVLTLKARGKNGIAEEEDWSYAASPENAYKAEILAKLRLVRIGRK